MGQVTIHLYVASEGKTIEHDLVSDVTVGPHPDMDTPQIGDRVSNSAPNFLHIEMMDDHACYDLVNVAGWHYTE